MKRQTTESARRTVMRGAALMLALLGALAVPACGGGGGGDDVEPSPPPPGGVGIGADGVPIFWWPYGTNEAVGAARAVQQTSDGGFIAAGFQAAGFAPPFDVYLLKTDAQGAAQWQKRFAFAGGAEAFGVRQTADGGYIVVGRTQTSGNNDVYLLKTDAAGNAAAGWPRTYSSGGAFDDVGYDVLPVAGGASGYLVVGSANVPDPYGPNADIYVLRTDASGNPLAGWPKFYSTDNTAPCGIAPEAGRAVSEVAGAYVIAGDTGCGWSGILLKIDGSGTQQWLKRYGPFATSSEWFASLAVAANGEIVVAGYRGLLSGQPPVMAPLDALVVKTDANGNEVWRRSHGLGEMEMAYGVALTRDAAGSPDGGYVVAGFTRSYGGPVDPAQPFQYEDVHLIKVDAAGDTLWQKVKGNRPMASDLANAVYGASDGGIVVGGASGGNVMLAKFDKNGDTVNLGATDLTINVPATNGVIDFGNALEVGAAAVTGLRIPHELGGTALDLLIAAVKGDAVAGFCNGGGSYAFDPAPTLPLASGAVFSLTFDDCVTGPADDLSTLNGGATLTLDAVSGTLTADDYEAAVALTAVNIQIAETGGTLSSTLSGATRFARLATSGDFAELSQSIVTPAPATLTVSETDGTTTRTRVLGPFAVTRSVSAAGAYRLGATTDALTVDAGLGSTLAVNVLAPLEGTAGADPASGSFRVLATDDSRLTTTVTAGVAALAVDTDGDGVDDGSVTYPWEFLD